MARQPVSDAAKLTPRRQQPPQQTPPPAYSIRPSLPRAERRVVRLTLVATGARCAASEVNAPTSLGLRTAACRGTGRLGIPRMRTRGARRIIWQGPSPLTRLDLHQSTSDVVSLSAKLQEAVTPRSRRRPKWSNGLPRPCRCAAGRIPKAGE